MKRILLALDSHNLNTDAIEFSCYLARQLRTKLTGVFIKRIASDQAPENTRNSAFCNACVCRDTAHELHPAGTMSASALVRESRFADLLILDPGISLVDKYEASPTAIVKYLMQKAECPVIIAPQNFEPIEEVIFACDEGNSSVHAIKQFTYLFPEFADKPISVLEVNSRDKNQQLKEWLDAHYRHTSFVRMEGDRLNRILGYLLMRNNAFVVMGAYSKNFISHYTAPGTIEHVAAALTRPVFVVHS